ncbi:unnamed protein product, partial [Onchocerca ochengi]|uniref:G protein-coupled receptor n=1 Tax=Onchocerca ochengi TaxID=42157 RepID=A0A182EN32_ONCOC
MPCICNAIVFLIGQVVLTVGISEGRWTLWLILVLFTLNASVDSVTLLIFSKTVRLILPCICNAVVFLIGQVVITVGISEGRWTLWLILVLFTLNASVDSVTLLIFSKTVRNTSLAILREVFCSNRKTVVIELI